MEWITAIKESINYIEENILTLSNIEDVAEHVSISPMYLQKGFQIITSYTLGEYIRNRRMYLAAKDIVEGKDKIIDVAYKYGYETPESFSKAFTRFHNSTPSEIRSKPYLIKTFLPLRINIVVQGGADMEYTVSKMKSFKVIGFSKEFSFDTSYKEIPQFWDEVFKKHVSVFSGKKPANSIEKAIVDNSIGEYGVCIDDLNTGDKFRYIIAGEYKGGEVPEGMIVYEIPSLLWAKFNAVGPMPDSLQSVNTKVWNEWLPGNPTYELAGKFNIEWYSNKMPTNAANYESAVWLPVKEK